MAYKPVNSFDGSNETNSTGTGGPAQLISVLVDLCAMFDPSKTHADIGTSPGGIGTENMQAGAVTDAVIGNRTVDDDIATALSDTATLNDLLSFFVKQLKAVAGTADWKATAAATVNSLDTRVDGIETIQITDINGLSGGTVTLSGGSGVDAHITISVDVPNKTITFTPVGTMVPAAHGSSHNLGGMDEIQASRDCKRLRLGVRI